MPEVANHTPFSAAGYFVRDRTGAEHWVAAVVACFDVRPDGMLDVAEEQPAPLLSPAFRDRRGRELMLEADLAPFRPQPDIVVSGIACQPGHVPGEQFDASVTVGRLTKTARFFGERVLRRAKGRTAVDGPAPVVGVHATWRNALGGPDVLDPGAPAHPHNPVGIGWTALWKDLPDGASFSLPYMENPARLIRPGEALPLPHGFGPLQPAWLPRASYAGSYADQWQKHHAPLPPKDFSELFHQCAPPDQVYPAAMDGGVPVRVFGFHGDGPYAFSLPQMVITTRTRIGRKAVDGRLRLVTMALDATEKVVRLTWNASVACNGRDTEVTGSRVVLKQMAGVVR